VNADASETIPADRRRGRPRSEQSRQAILEAAGELLREEGLRAMSIEGVAKRAGVSKATIYRWWPSKGVLALDAFYGEWARGQGLTADTGTLRGDLRSRLRAIVRLLASKPLGSTLAALVAEMQSDPQLAAAYREHVQQPLREESRVIFRRAVERGEISPDADIEAATDLLHGPLFLRLLQAHAPLTRRFADTIVELAIAGVAPNAGDAGNRSTQPRSARRSRYSSPESSPRA
jgi:AcrR family transcriptional regulator